MDSVFRGTANAKGTVDFDRPVDFRRYVARFAGRGVEVIVRRPKSIRSLNQNRYYFGVVIATIAAELGYTKDEAHEAIAWKFLQEGEADAKLPKRKSTATLTTHEMEDYISQVKQFAAEELHIYIPDPNEVSL
jgi:hypothetical protein